MSDQGPVASSFPRSVFTRRSRRRVSMFRATSSAAAFWRTWIFATTLMDRGGPILRPLRLL